MTEFSAGIRKICEGEVNEFFLQHLMELNKKMTYVKSQKGSHIRALKDVGPEMERLRLKVSILLGQGRACISKQRIVTVHGKNPRIPSTQNRIIESAKYKYLHHSAKHSVEIQRLVLVSTGKIW
jgi:hypothetical protein